MSEHKAITLVLSGAGSWGLAHLGVMEVLQSEEIPIERIVGVSSGAFFGGLIASGNEAADLIASMKRSRWAPVRSLWNFAFSLKGMFRARPFVQFFRGHLKEELIDDFPIKFAAVAGEVTEGSAVVFDSGDAFDAIRSSISVPGLIRPVERENHIYIDGAYISPLPVRIARSLGASPVVAVDVRISLSVFRNKITRKERNAGNLFYRSLALLFWQLSEREAEEADVVIKPAIRSDQSYLDFVYDEKIVEAGREAARDALPELKKLIARR